MDSTRRRMIAVAVTVCGFAVGMAGLLNYFKYRTTANRVVTERLIVTGKAVENSIQSALALGLQFSEIGTLQSAMERERLADPLIVGIDIFDLEGNPLYTTDRLRAKKAASEDWLEAARRAGVGSWASDDGTEAATGMPLRNNFELPIGFLAVRYAGERVRETAFAVGRELAITSLVTFLVSAVLSSLAVAWVTRGLARDMKQVEMALRDAAGHDRLTAHAEPAAVPVVTTVAGATAPDPSTFNRSGSPTAAANQVRGDLGRALRRFLRTTQGAQRRIAAVRASLHQGLER